MEIVTAWPTFAAGAVGSDGIPLAAVATIAIIN
jgi:hypothetical protein